ncbi:MAG: invasion associated locus B family protein [Hyphomicrobiales bacterium]
MKMFFRPVSTLIAATAVCGLLTSGALSQETKPAAPQAAAPQAASAISNTNAWYKICEVDPRSKAKLCTLNFSLANEKGAVVAQARVIEQVGAPQKGFSFALPPGLLIQPGMRIQIDGAKTGTAKFQVCTQQACFAEARFDKGFISNLKRGNEMKIIGINPAGKQAEFPITLTGFTAAYDGPAIDPKALAKTQETLQDRLQRKADEARKKLLEKENKEGAAAEPAKAAE